MIAYIKGTLAFIYDSTIVVDVNGIGYEVICANPFVFQESINKEIFIYTYHHVREDAEELYGFKTEDEKYLFTKLISVSGIGPKSGINIQGSVNVSDFVSAVEREDKKYLMSFRGVGKKTAQQIILDLKGKLTGMLSVTEQTDTSKHTSTDRLAELTEAEEALRALGYQEQEISSIKPELQKLDDKTTDDIIRHALALLMKN